MDLFHKQMWQSKLIFNLDNDISYRLRAQFERMITLKYTGLPLTDSVKADITRDAADILSPEISRGEISGWSVNVADSTIRLNIQCNNIQKVKQLTIPLGDCNG